MTNEHEVLVAGAMLHDIGKVVYRAKQAKNHSQSGFDYLKEEIGLGETEEQRALLECVMYHHASFLKAADIADDSPAYITYIADNIASASDRRASDSPEPGFDTLMPLESIFNHLNGDGQTFWYSPQMLEENTPVNYPSEEKKNFTSSQYGMIWKKITDSLKAGMKWDRRYINSLLEILEAALSYIPSSTSKRETADISLYDHLKITTAVSSCIYLYLQERGERDYRTALFKNAEEFYDRDVFLLYSIDISGIQNFIYTVQGAGSLRMLRAKSFYLEIFTENLIDEIFDEIGVFRPNLIYCGGGHMYALLPNTADVRQSLDTMERKVNSWLLDNFGTALYVASGYAACSARDLQNEPKGSYKAIYQEIGRVISQKKAHRYTARDIIELNRRKLKSNSRECRVCRNTGPVDDDGLCTMCASLKGLSTDILKKDFFCVLSSPDEDTGPVDAGGANCGVVIPLMENRWLKAGNEEDVKRMIRENDASFVRVFSKNAFYSGQNISSKLWTGDYTARNGDLRAFVEDAAGIGRMAVLRMDVDNLGQAFVSGFENGGNDDRYVTLSRTAAFSRQMTIFFKHHINYILSHSDCCALEGTARQSGGTERMIRPTGSAESDGEGRNDRNEMKSGAAELMETGRSGEVRNRERSLTIVYSGGDDVFLVGAWNDVVEAAVDIRNCFGRFCQNKLTISGGIGLYGGNYPIHIMAEETGKLEDFSKDLDGKNAVTLFESQPAEYDSISAGNIGAGGTDGVSGAGNGGRYRWDDFQNYVLGEKYSTLFRFFRNSDERGNSVLYHLLELIRNRQEKINFARYVYLLSRMEPDEDASEREKTEYRIFSKKMYQWIKSDEDSRQLVTAIYLYVYYVRDAEENVI